MRSGEVSPLSAQSAQTLISHRSNSTVGNCLGARVWQSVCQLAWHGRRTAATFVLIAMLLAPFFCGPILFATEHWSSRRMACCKKAKASCCPHSEQKDRPGSPLWVSLPGCPPGCGQSMALPLPPYTTLAAGRGDFRPAATISLLQPAEHGASPNGHGEFGLFGRPPPSIPILHT